VRERRGLAYRVRASAGAYEDVGAFEITAGLEKNKVDQALKVIVAELTKMKTKKVSKAELHRAKENIRGSFILDFEDSEEVAAFYGRQALFNKTIETPEQVLAKIAAVTADDILKVCTTVFKSSAYRLGMIGPLKDDGSWAKLLRG
jgi:predicted Zn-dependent peptidase